MPAYLDSMMYVGDKPWHNEGIQLGDPPTIPEALYTAGLNWEVKKAPTYFHEDHRTDGESYVHSLVKEQQTGYYVVYLFSVDMKRVYLSLNQGITFLKDELGEPAAINELKRRASFIRDRIKEYKDSFSFEAIDLSANLSSSHRPKLYEPGHAFGKKYEVNKIPDEQILVNDLKKILELYLLLTHRGGLDTDLTGSDFEPENLKDQPLEERKRYRRHISL